ncbi:MAG: GNAT family N-acetyltransferase [Myxococcota bacterium]|nr:GNAT family N-acetyltransferase [Myxococcota bacterium]
MDDVKIRNAVLEDAASLADLSTKLGYASTSQQVADRLEVMLRSREHLVLVACFFDGSVVGWAHVFLARRIESETFSEIGGLVVTEQYRGQGIGRSLLGAAENWGRGKGIKRLRVRSRSTRHDAHAFYKQLGFSLTKEQWVLDKPIELFT